MPRSPAASPSAVYDVLRDAGTLYRPPREEATLRRPPLATRPDQRWHLDVLYRWVFGRWYSLVTVIDAYSRAVGLICASCVELPSIFLHKPSPASCQVPPASFSKAVLRCGSRSRTNVPFGT